MTKKTSNGRLAGKTALVTGIGAGIGQGCALMFAREGANVFGSDINADAGSATVAIAQGEGLNMVSLDGIDLTNEAGVEQLVEAVVAKYGRIDVLVNAAAYCKFEWIEDLDYETTWKRSIAGELDIVFLSCQKAWKYLKVRGGSIINFASANARQALKGSPALVHCATKGGPHQIRVNTISPGLVHTAATNHLATDPTIRTFLNDKHMLGRIGTPEDIAYAALFLASDESSWVTGADFPIDGGASKW